MKATIILLVFSSIVATIVSASCIAHCQTEVMSQLESGCALWRKKYPMPDLYSQCQDGYTAGRITGCNEGCAEKPNTHAIEAARLKTCQSLRGQMPTDLLVACKNGFSTAVEKARKMARKHPIDSGRNLATAAKEAANNLDHTAIKESKKASEAKNMLEKAREQAAAAFEFERASEF